MCEGVFSKVLSVKIFDMELKEIIYHSCFIIILVVVALISIRGKPRKVIYPKCNGVGAKPTQIGFNDWCSNCNGTGQI